MSLEQLREPIDFRDRLRETRRAALGMISTQSDGEQPIANAPHTSLLEAYADLPDDHIIYLPPLFPETAVLTTDPSQYMALLRQAAEVSLENDKDGFPVGFEEAVDEWARELERHERAHGAVVETSGNSQTVTYYGIEWVVQGETADVRACNKVSGPIRKVHLAYSSMAPDDDLISSADIRIATELGYDITDIAGLRKRSEATPPIPEDYDPNTGIADFLTRVMWAALHTQ